MPAPSKLPIAGLARRAALPAALLALPLALAACSNPGAGEQFAPVCPQLALLRDGADLTRFAPRGHDVTDLIVDGRLTAVPATCTYGPKHTVAATLKVTMTLTRGPAAQGRTVDVPYFVAVTRDGAVVDKQVYGLRATFPPNVEQSTFTSDDVLMYFPVTEKQPASMYRIFVSFQLSPEELAVNRKRGPR